MLLLARSMTNLGRVDDDIRATGGTASLVPLDLTDGQAIDALGPSLYERFGRLDVLRRQRRHPRRALAPPPHPFEPIGIACFAVNVTANWRLIRTLDPLFRRSDAARVIFVTSSVARSGRAYWAPYSVSKAALEALAKTYANETADTPDQGEPCRSRAPWRHACAPKPILARIRRRLPTPEQVTEIFVRLAMAETDVTGQLFTPEV